MFFPEWTESANSFDDSLCLPVVDVNGVQYPFDYPIVGPYERIISDFSRIPIANIGIDTIGVGNNPSGDRQLYSVRNSAHRTHSQVPCPYVWHSTPWKSYQEAEMSSTIAIRASSIFVTAGMPLSNFFSVPIGSAFHPTVDTSRAGLQALYAATSGPLWIRAFGWASTSSGNTSPDFCGWYGVECSGEEVIAVELSANNLAGTLPRAFFYYLPALRRLNLSGNRLVGSIPPDISLCTELAEARRFLLYLSLSRPRTRALP